MSGDAITVEWGGAERRFALPIAQLRELQRAVECGPVTLWMRLSTLDWRVDDAREVIRLGLIGGGMEPSRAASLVAEYHDKWVGDPIHRTVARGIMAGALSPPPGSPVPKATATGTSDPEAT